MSRRHVSVFDDLDVAAELAELHQKFVVVQADKAFNNSVFVCRTHYMSQPVLAICEQPRSLIRTSVVRSLDSIIALLAISKFQDSS